MVVSLAQARDSLRAASAVISVGGDAYLWEWSWSMLERDMDAHIARLHNPVKRCSASGSEPVSLLANAGVIEPGDRARFSPQSHHNRGMVVCRTLLEAAVRPIFSPQHPVS
jgi:hypothetical protein